MFEFGARSSAFGHVFDRLSGCLHEKSIAAAKRVCFPDSAAAWFIEPAKALYTTTNHTKPFASAQLRLPSTTTTTNKITEKGVPEAADSTYNVAAGV